MKTTTRKEYERKVREYEWEVESEENRYNRVEVRDTRTNRRYTVTVQD